MNKEQNTDIWSIKEVADALEEHGLIREQEPCEDAVSRQAVKDILDARGAKAIMTFEHFKELLDKLPSVNSQPKIGHWIEHQHEAGENWEFSKYECSECHVWGDDNSDYCPNCGVKMESEDKDEDNN